MKTAPLPAVARPNLKVATGIAGFDQLRGARRGEEHLARVSL
jgi:hypothetical protein